MKVLHAKPNPWAHMTRRWVFSGLRTFLWVASISVLIWVYADIQFTDRREITADARIHAESSPNMVVLEPAEPVRVKFVVSGNRYVIDRFADRLRMGEFKLLLDAARQFGEKGLHREQTATLLGTLQPIREAGLDVVWAEPRQLEISLDELRTLSDLPVRLETTGGELDLAATRIAPDRLSIQVPESRLKGLDVSKLELPTQPIDLSQVPAGEIITRDVAIQLPAALQGARLPQRTVQVSFKVATRTASMQFKGVAIYILAPRSWETDNTWSLYKPDSPPQETWTRDLTVVGNQIDLQKLRKEDIHAYIVLSETDKTNPVASWLPGKVHVRLPPELKVQLSSEPIEPVQYRLVKRAETPAPGG